jgi:hypothetical protein
VRLLSKIVTNVAFMVSRECCLQDIELIRKRLKMTKAISAWLLCHYIVNSNSD